MIGQASRAGAPPAAVAYRPSRPRRLRVAGLVGLGAVLVGVAVLSVLFGSRPIAPGTVLESLLRYQPASSDHEVVVAGRLPRLAAGVLVGTALGLAGTLMQAITRNPLADPGLLGVNAGAALAVVVAIGWLGLTAPTGYIWFAFAGAGLVAALVYGVGSLGAGGATPVKLTLAGAAVGAALTSLTTAVLLSDAATFDQHRFWTVGALAGRRWDLVAPIAPFIVVGVLLALATGRTLNALVLGDDTARALGQRVGPARLASAAVAVLLCGAATALAGPIWFVGLAVPHVARLFTGPDYRWILPYAMVLAPILLLASDVVGRLVARPGELQVGIVMSLLGAPLFIWLVRRQRLREL